MDLLNEFKLSPFMLMFNGLQGQFRFVSAACLCVARARALIPTQIER